MASGSERAQPDRTVSGRRRRHTKSRHVGPRVLKQHILRPPGVRHNMVHEYQTQITPPQDVHLTIVKTMDTLNTTMNKTNDL